MFGWFAPRALTDKDIDKLAKAGADPFAQPDVRLQKMQRLLKEGTPAALLGVLRRFSSNAQGHIADEEEKTWLVEQLVAAGEPAATALRRFIRKESKLTYALLAYRQLRPDDASDFFLQVLLAYGPEDHRNQEAKLQLAADLLEHLLPTQLAALLPFTLDHNDDVQYLVLRGLAAAPAEAQAALRPGLLECCLQLLSQAGASPRITQQAAYILADAGAQLPKTLSLPSSLQAVFFLDKAHYLRRRSSAAEP